MPIKRPLAASIISLFWLLLLLVACSDNPTTTIAPTILNQTTVVSTSATVVTTAAIISPALTLPVTTAIATTIYDGTTAPIPPYTNKILVTNDGGKTWTAVYSVLNKNIDNLVCPTSSDCYITTKINSNKLLVTADGGKSWEANDFYSFYSYYNSGLSCPNATTCFALSDAPIAGEIVVTTNSGRTWSSLNRGKKSSDGGKTWAGVIDSKGEIDREFEFLRAINCPSITTCIAVGTGGRVMTTTDAGSTWKKYSGITDGFISIRCPDLTTCYAIGSLLTSSTGPLGKSKIEATKDGGKTWELQSSDAIDGYFEDISCPAITTCFVVGGAGAIFTTTDGGRNWVQQNSGTQMRLYRVSCSSGANCFVAGENGTLITTNDVAKLGLASFLVH